jgi:primosomal protein N' (replication factor Y)
VWLRAPERTAQLIVQVAGRAGRGEHKGTVYLQSLRPDHPMLTTLIKHDYRAVAKQMLAERKMHYCRPIVMRLWFESNRKIGNIANSS